MSPLEDGTQPCNTILVAMFDILRELPLSVEILASTGLGKIVGSIVEDPNQPIDNRRRAEDLIGYWSLVAVGVVF